MKQDDTYQFLQGQIIALTYSVNLCLKHHPEERAALQDVARTLEELSASMLENGAIKSADGVERIRMALINSPRAKN